LKRAREEEKAARMAEAKKQALEAKARREQEAAATQKSPSKSSEKPKAAKYGEVQKINKQAERIAEGDKPPGFFWGGGNN